MLDDRSIKQIILITREVKIIKMKLLAHNAKKVEVYNNQPKSIPLYFHTVGAAISKYSIMIQ